MHGTADDSGAGLPLFWTCPAQVCLVDDLGVYGLLLRHRLSMVFLGILACLQPERHERLHWRPATFRTDEDSGSAVAGFAAGARASVFLLSGEDCSIVPLLDAY